MRSRCQKCLNEIGSVAICNWTSPLDSYHAHKNSTVIAVGLQRDILLKYVTMRLIIVYICPTQLRRQALSPLTCMGMLLSNPLLVGHLCLPSTDPRKQRNHSPPDWCPASHSTPWYMLVCHRSMNKFITISVLVLPVPLSHIFTNSVQCPPLTIGTMTKS